MRLKTSDKGTEKKETDKSKRKERKNLKLLDDLSVPLRIASVDPMLSTVLHLSFWSPALSL